jgi:hypothetical protein
MRPVNARPTVGQHPGHVEVFDDEPVVSLDQRVRDVVQEMPPHCLASCRWCFIYLYLPGGDEASKAPGILDNMPSEYPVPDWHVSYLREGDGKILR